MYFLAGFYTFTAHGPDALDHGGLDLSVPMFAPCWLRRPGTQRQHAVSQPAANTGTRTERHVLADSGVFCNQFREKNRTEQRTLNLRAHRSSCRVPYGNLDDHYLRLGPGPAGSEERRLWNAPDSLARSMSADWAPGSQRPQAGIAAS